MSLPLPHRRFTVDEYYRMAEAGILGEDDRVELIEGEIVEMTPIGSRHAAVVNRLNRSLKPLPEERYPVAVQNPIRLGTYSVPQPDLAVLRARTDDYEEGHPGPEDVLLLMEVVDSSEGHDRRVKLELYAKAAIPEVWLIDLRERTIDVFGRPREGTYSKKNTFRPGDEVASVTVPELVLPVKAVFPSPASRGA